MRERKTVGIIPARGGSKGIPRKNIVKLQKRALISYTIDASLKSEQVDRTIVTTDDEEIADVSATHDADIPFMRPESLAQDETPTEPVVKHALDNVGESFDEFALLQPTSPLRTEYHIDGAIENFYAKDATSLVSVFEDHSYRWKPTADGAKQINYNGDRKRRQEKSSEYVENGAIYMTTVEDFRNTGSFTTGKTVLYEMDKLDSIDIDEPVDLQLAESILRARDQ